MKFRYLILLFIGSLIFYSCSKEGVPADNYFYASIDGPSWNGEVRIMGEEEELVGQASIVPTGDPSAPEVLTVIYNDTEEDISVTISVPAEKRTTELTDDHEYFGMGMTNGNNPDDEVMLVSKTLSIDITTFKTNSTGVFGLNLPSTVIGNFTGVMIHEKFENGQRIEEAHTVQGDFKYYSE